MKTITYNLFTFAELTSEAQLKAIEEAQKAGLGSEETQFMADDLEQSMLKIAKELGMGIKGYSFGAYDRNYNIRAEVQGWSEVNKRRGKRELARIQKLASRMGDKIAPKTLKEFEGHELNDSDHKTLMWLFEAIQEGNNIEEAFGTLGEKYSKELGEEDAYFTGDESIRTMLEDNDDEEKFLEDGTIG